MRVFNPAEVPDSYKAKVYDQLCAYFIGTLPAYYTEDDTPVDPRYDSGVANERTEVIGLEFDLDAEELLVSIAIKGWADTHCFSVPLPPLDRDQEYGESTGIEI